MREKRFKKGQPRYVTRGVNDSLPFVLQMVLWNMVDNLRKEKKLDYLQVFELETLGSQEERTLVQVVTHSQEQPRYSRIYYFPIADNGVTGKIYIIDDGDHATMLWADEY